MRFRVVIVSASLCVAMCLSVGVLAQSSVQGAVSQGVWEVDWLPKGTESAPVGIWAPMDGFWLDEIPWVLWEAELNGFEAGMERLVDTESWAEVPADELTPRQRQLLMTKTIIPQWRHVVIEDLVSVQY